jgi:NAD(P)-dependent dehydrogenase (short-subunit alcohol dehydrogenase family)
MSEPAGEQSGGGAAGSGRLAGKVAIVTGGASGMGRATVERFLDEGASVAVGDLNTVAGEEMMEELASDGERLRFLDADVSVERDVEALVETARQELGGLDIIFNNAGIGGAIGPLAEIDVEHWDETFGVLTRGVFLGIKHGARAMIEQGRGGVILNTASVAGLAGGGGPQAYSAAKAAVVNLSANAALELAPHRIRVNTICPGIIFTPLMHGGYEADAEEVIRRIQPWPDRGEGEDIAATALFLCSDESSFITGQSIVVDGGLLAAGTRIWGEVRGTRHLDRVSGIAYGTTGKAPTVRRLD